MSVIRKAECLPARSKISRARTLRRSGIIFSVQLDTNIRLQSSLLEISTQKNFLFSAASLVNPSPHLPHIIVSSGSEAWSHHASGGKRRNQMARNAA